MPATASTGRGGAGRDLDAVLDNRTAIARTTSLCCSRCWPHAASRTQALINAGGQYVLPRVPVASVVNHVINYVPALDLYLDATASDVPFGSLPHGTAGKPVLLVDGHHEGAATPLREAGRDGQKVRTDCIAADGSRPVTCAGTGWVVGRRGTRAVSQRARLRISRWSGATERRPWTRKGPCATRSRSVARRLRTMRSSRLPRAAVLRLPLQPWFISYAPIAGIVAGNAGSSQRPPGESNCKTVLEMST